MRLRARPAARIRTAAASRTRADLPLALAFAWLACGAPAAHAAATEPTLVAEPGLYRCELERRVLVRRVTPGGGSMVIGWQGRDHTLAAVRARTGALRFENARDGLLWLVIPGKSILLDTQHGQQLANECTL